MDIILFGMQGSGKGTLGKALAKDFDMKIFETGGVLREIAKEESKLGKKIKEIQASGQLVPSDVINEIIRDFIDKNIENKIIFDGVPRTIEQATALIDILEEKNRNYKALLLNITEEEAMRRLTQRRMCKSCKAIYPASYDLENCEICGGELYSRSDDVPETIKIRIENYKNQTIPAIKMFNDKLITINGEQSIENVEKDAKNEINKF